MLAGIVAAPAWALCPNGVVEPPETCDDGNLIAGDGCSPLCLLEVMNLPPVCTDAVASVESLWPPNHKLVPVAVDGVTDPDGDPVAIVVTAIAQDEPVDGSGDGSTCADAEGVGTDTALLRSERSGQGDGRVYHVAFAATDPLGASCTGSVDVCVRHDNGHGGLCGDQGPLFDSTVGVCVPDDDCDLHECVPPPVAGGACDDADLPPAIDRRLHRAGRLLDRAAAAGRRRQRFLTHLARVQLARLDRLVARHADGDCELELHDMLEHAMECAACPAEPHSGDD